MASGSNPFEDNNPFADPSIQNITQSTHNTQTKLDDYNPFTQTNTRVPQPAIIPTAVTTAPQPTTSQASQQPPPPPLYTPSAAQNINLESIQKQQEELAKKAAELDRKEQALRNAPLALGASQNKNFPPLPRWFPLQPCFYQDIGIEIPIDFQKWVRILFYLWIFHGCTLFFNVIGALVVWIATNEGVSFGLAILYFFLFTPCSYVCWFRPAYKAFRSDSSFNFMVFFFIFFCQVIVNCFEAIGIPDSGFCGIILMSKIFANPGVSNIVAGIFVLLVATCFLFIALADILVLIKIHRLYRSTGASFEQAQKEFASNVLTNKNVQNAAATVITEGARATVQNYNTTPGRF